MSEASPSPSGAVIDVDATTLSPSDFDPSLSEDERRFYAKAYPSIDLVRERKVHCTTCKMHIGTAPAQENGIKMHPILRVTHCTKCHDFYNSGEFSKGEDGSELYCRWCGQGGEVYCCSNCPFVFCKSCIVKNLSRGVVADIEQNENWSCFNCAPKILWPLRAQHWALIKYIDKQKKEITAMNLPEAETKQEMLKDRSMCCRLAKAKLGSMSDSMESIDSLSRRSVSGMSPGSSSKKLHKLAPRSHSPAAKRPKTSNDEVVCTPDLLSMLEPDCQITVSAKPRPSQSPVASSPKVMSIQNPGLYGNNSMQCSTPKNTPPPLVLRNTSVQMRPMQQSPIVRRTVVGPRMSSTGTAAPVYHTINGYRIDLNSAAQQETFRLPNGKLIQVKRQGSGNAPTPPSQQTQSQQPHNAWQRNLQLQQQSRPVQITPAHINSQQQYSQITIQQHAPQQHPQMVRYQNTMVGNTTVTALHNGSAAQIQVINGAPGGPAPQQQQHAAPQQQPQQQAVPQQQARPLMVRHVFPDTAIGLARTQLQEQVFNAMEICQHLTGKVQTLTNSNAYKQARNYLEVKELYIHLSYLLTYAIGRFKGLQDKCLGDMRQLGFVNDADSLENGQLAAGVDYVRYGKLDDVELFNTGCNSFHNQVYEYRKSLHVNLENTKDGDEPPLSPLHPLSTCFVDKDENIDPDAIKTEAEEATETHKSEDADESEMQEPEDSMVAPEEESSMFNSYMGGDEENVNYTNDYEQEDDYDMSRPGGSIEYTRRDSESHAIDHKLTRLIEQYPSIWCTRHPDYSNFEITRRYWQRIQMHFKNNENIKLRWKNIRKRFVRIEDRLKTGKRFNGFYDKATNFLFNRNLPQRDWMEVDKGNSQHLEPIVDDVVNESWTKAANYANDYEQENEQINDEGDFRSSSIKPLDIRTTDMKIINFVKCNPVLWRKAYDAASQKFDEQTRRTLWMHLWKQLPAASSCEALMDRWTHLYELYKTFRLKTIKDENTLADMEVKYSKYLATLHFLYKIDEEDLRKENLVLQDCENLDDLPEDDSRMQDKPDDNEFTIQLVRAVFKRVPLWSNKHPDFHDAMRREELWSEIAIDLNDFNHKQASDDEDNEIEIVEPKTDTITLDSDNDDDEPPATYIPNPSKVSVAPLTPTTPLTTIPNPVSEVDFLSTAQSFLASMLEVDLNEGDQNSAQASPSANSSDATQKKQPRKKTTHKPNPTLLKQKELLERERLEEMKRNDMKLKMKCTIELKKAEEEYPFAKDMLNESDEGAVGENVNKKEDDNEEVELLFVEDMDSSLEDDKPKAEDNQMQEKTNESESNKKHGEIKTGDTKLEKKDEVTVSIKKKTDEESASKQEQNCEESKGELKDETNDINTEKPVTAMEVEMENPTKSQVLIKDTESHEQKNDTAEDKDIEMPKILTIEASKAKESDDITNSSGNNEISDSNISKEKEYDDNNSSETKALDDVNRSETKALDDLNRSETKESDRINDTEIKDSDKLNSSETKEIEMIEVPEEEEEEEIENSHKDIDEVECKKETNKNKMDEEGTELLAAVNANSDLADVTPTSSALINGDSEAKEKLELMVQTLTSDNDENKASITEPNKDNVGEADDLMDDISELIEDASNALT